MSILLTILAFLTLWWVFWPIVTILTLITYFTVNQKDEDDFEAGALALLAVTIAGLTHYFDAWLIFAWPTVLYTVGGYVAIGAVIMGYKWLTLLSDFRPKAREWLKEREHLNETPEDKRKGLSNALYGYHDNNKVKVLRDLSPEVPPIYFLNWRAFPLANWVVFWPFFSLSVILDPILRVTRRVIKWCGEIFEAIAKKFAVS